MELSKAETVAVCVNAIRRYKIVVSMIEDDGPLIFGTATRGVDWVLPDDVRGDLLRHFRKQLEFYSAELAKL